MYERFSDRARKVLALANQEAQRENCGYIAPEHILLGLIKEGSGVGAFVLRNLDLDLRKVRRAVEGLKDQQTHQQPGPPEKLPQTEGARHVIEYAIEESRALNHSYVGTEHLLLGVIHDEHTIPGQVFAMFGVTPEQVRQEVINIIQKGANQERVSMLQEDMNAVILTLLREIREAQIAAKKDWEEEIVRTKQEWREAVAASEKRAKIHRRKAALVLTGALVLMCLVLFWDLLPFNRCNFGGFGNYSYLTGQKHYEARQWLADNAGPSPLASNRFGEKENAIAFVEQLYQAGARAVYVVNIMNDPQTIRDEGGPYADSLVVMLPEDKDKREKLFELIGAESRREGFDPDKDHGQKELFLWWD